MAGFTVTGPDGKKYNTDAPTVEEAVKSVQGHVQGLKNAEFKKNAEEAPEWAKPLMAVQDAAISGIDTLSAGTIPWAVDKLTGTDDAKMTTAASRNRMGWAAPALDIGMLARFLPSLAPKAISALKGGPAAKTITGAVTAAGEGATYGGVNAATHDEDVPTGAALGGAGGAAGSLIGSGVNRVAKAVAPSDVPTATGILSTTNLKNPTNVQKIEAAVNKANEGASGSKAQSNVQSNLKGLVVNAAPKEFTPTQTRLMKKVYEGDPATNASRVVGDFLNNKMLAGGAGAGAFIAGSPVGAALLGGGMLAGGKALKSISAGGTEEAVQNLRRTMFKKPKFVGPVSDAEKARIANMVRMGMLTDYPED